MDLFELAVPSRLVWLLGLPLLYWLSRPPQPKEDSPTAYLALWVKARDRLRRRPIRFLWLRFVLLVLAFVALVLAHSEPSIPGRVGATDLVVLLDTSASMASDEGQSSPWDQAVAKIEAALVDVPGTVDVRVGLCGEQVRVLRGSREELLDRIHQEVPSGSLDVDLQGLVDQLQSHTTAVWLLTDGRGGMSLPGNASLSLVGQPSANVAITACSLVDDWPLPSLVLKVEIRNFGPPCGLGLEISGGVGRQPSKPIEFAAGGLQNLTVPLVRTTGGRLGVRLVAGNGSESWLDGLAVDNGVKFEIPAPPSPTIAVRTQKDTSRAVWAAARALAGEFGGEVVEGDVSQAAFLITDGGRLEGLPVGLRMLTFGTSLGSAAPKVTGPHLLDWNREDSITAGLDLSELRIETALDWRPPSALKGVSAVLFEGDSGPLGLVVGVGKAKSIHLAFRLGESNFYKLAAFPQFVRRAFARSFGAEASWRRLGPALLDARESNLGGVLGAFLGAQIRGNRPLPGFATPSSRLALPLLVLALLFVVLRAYV